ncbi:MAG: alpha/beta fold hydrolase [Parachlamydiales bacterium]|nr:alpha/beta fold hydrolase [Verrucomicrobiota bacterium]MBX3719269.1 alpha/beta fold hydrolase [Candidatus Acheromyda pituitae]
MLEYDAHGDIANPALIFLHGFLGSREDWAPMIEKLKRNFFCVALELAAVDAIAQTLSQLHLHNPTYVGYSMGGRTALQLPLSCPSIILSAHIGLDTEQEKTLRWEEDLRWIQMLETQPIRSFLEKWYAQPLFQSLRKQQALFEQVLQRRSQQDPVKLALILRQMSLGKQPKITAFHPQSLFLFGEEDLKYEQLYAKLPQTILRKKIPNAGHAVHLENPDACVGAIEEWSQANADN